MKPLLLNMKPGLSTQYQCVTLVLIQIIPTLIRVDPIFLSHLHSDHFGDLGAVYVAGNLSGRHRSLKIWGPSGASPELGTRAAV